jgi:hypothetical protein
MKVPNNLISYDYTIGGEFVYASSQKEYQGYYYRIGDQFFIGKEFQNNSLEIIKKTSPKYNSLLENPSLKVYSSISKITSQDLTSVKFTSSPVSKTQKEEVDTYYVKKLNVIPSLIKQVDKTAYSNLQKDPFYQVVSLKADRSNLEQAEKQMPGLKAFLYG